MINEDRSQVRPVHVGEPLRFPTLDAVRFLAFFAVFCSHAFKGYAARVMDLDAFSFVPDHVRFVHESGGFGVDLFLVLSAFLITSLLAREHDDTGDIRVGSFYVRRLLRIWPLYLTFLALMFFVDEVVAWGAAGFEPIDNGYWWSFLGLVGNWYVGLKGFPEGNITPLWSVSLEEQFYLFWPWLLLAFRRRLPMVAWAFLSISLTMRVLLAAMDASPLTMWTFTVTRLDPIALGILLAHLHRQGRFPVFGPRMQWLVFVGGFASWPLLHVLFPEQALLGLAAVRYPLVALTSAAILAAAVSATGGLRRFLVHPWMVRMGTLSYGTYVIHYAALALVVAILLAVSGNEYVVGLGAPVIGFALTWVLAEASYRWLETPFLDLRRRFRPVKARPPSSPASPTVKDAPPPADPAR